MINNAEDGITMLNNTMNVSPLCAKLLTDERLAISDNANEIDNSNGEI